MATFVDIRAFALHVRALIVNSQALTERLIQSSQANTEGAQKVTRLRPFEEQLARSDGLYAPPFTSLACSSPYCASRRYLCPIILVLYAIPSSAPPSIHCSFTAFRTATYWSIKIKIKIVLDLPMPSAFFEEPHTSHAGFEWTTYEA